MRKRNALLAGFLLVSVGAFGDSWIVFYYGGPDADDDEDCLTTEFEQRIGTHPSFPDSDRNGVNDGEEDPDLDGLTNCEEQAAGTDPLHPDSDRDGFADGEEINNETDPDDAGSRPLRYAISNTVNVLNASPQGEIRYAISQTTAVLNVTPQSEIRYAISEGASVLNVTTDTELRYSISDTVTVENLAE